ncbi:UbiA family prenyltransferase [Candidatus Micrarchaeota archaeon]|nr:UbiA family prenyltransferase [Candidatus Micrarchaeota archaeon]
MLKDWWKLFRAEHALMVFIAILLTELVVAGELTTSSVLAALGPVFVTLGAFAFNDYSGFKSDSALKRIDRPIVAGKISRKQALGASLILFALGNALALLFAPLIGFLIVVFFAVFSVLYDLYLKKLPLIGNVFVASTYSASYFYGNIIVSNELNFFVIVFITMAFFSGLGREFIITLRDVEGDKKTGAKTLPMILGSKKTITLASMLIYLGVVASMLPLIKSFYLPYLVLIGLADAIWLGLTLLLFVKVTPLSLKKARNYSLYAMGFGLLALASLVFA